MSASQESGPGVAMRRLLSGKEERPLLRGGGTSEISFKEFEGATSDAWDAGPDELMEILKDRLSKPSPIYTRPTSKSTKDKENNIKQVRGSSDSGRANSTEIQNLETNSLQIRRKSVANIDIATVNKLSEELVKSKSDDEDIRFAIIDEGKSFVFPSMPPSAERDLIYNQLSRFGRLLSVPTTDMDDLRKCSWNGIPQPLRGRTWRLLSGYTPAAVHRRQETLQRKRAEYKGFVEQYYPTRAQPHHDKTYRQICKDVPRMAQIHSVCTQQSVQEIFQRILFIWAIRHPASGYVQGINDFLVPFFVVFLEEYANNSDVDNIVVDEAPSRVVEVVEADTYWCVSKLLQGVQDNYTPDQPGIQQKINTLKNLMERINNPLHKHIVNMDIDYLHFAFRWMNNLLMRELPLKASIRLWDTYWAEPDGFSIFHLYVCAALLKGFAADIMKQETHLTTLGLLLRLPCEKWTEKDISCLVSEAYQLRFMFDDAPQHLRSK